VQAKMIASRCPLRRASTCNPAQRSGNRRATIEGAAATVTLTLTEAACQFVTHMRELATAYDDVYPQPLAT